ncbi:glycosyltransferase family 4 protein [Haloarcula marina]|uniref:glycosyltransferase family 4 protein n=1 Tax=Haloarcula marina TaxID=2961574 RepID=UPI0020B81725|nr:glycosyltransferase family 4 protein [Halomicroarcula marina]
MEKLSVIMVGPVNHTRGGMSQYIEDLTKNLSDDVNVHTHHVGSLDKDWPGAVFVAAIYSAYCLVRFLVRHRTDIVHVHASFGLDFYRSIIYSLITKYIWRRPLVFHVHGSEFDQFVQSASFWQRQVTRLVFSISDEILTISEYSRDSISSLAEDEKITHIHHSVEPEAYDPQYQTNPLRITFISDIIYRKGILDLDEIIREVLDRGDTNVKFHLAGTGMLQDQFEKLDEEFSSVKYHGYVSEEEKHRLLSESLVFMLPTYSEAGPPIAIVEAMGGGNAIVTTDTSGIPELIKHRRNGIVEQVGDVQAFTSSLHQLLGEPEIVIEMARRNRKIIETRLNWAQSSQKVEEVYNKFY